MKNYKQHINSKEWFDKHDKWLKQSGGFCALLPFIPIGSGSDRKLLGVLKVPGYFPYQTHHLSYKVPEVYGLGVVCLSPLAHMLIIHGICAGFQPAGKQRFLGRYPNILQQLLHNWCRLPLVLKQGLVLFIGWQILINQIR